MNVRWTKKEETRRNHIMRSCIIPIARHPLLGWSNQGCCDVSAMWHGVWWEHLKKGWHSEVLNVDRRKMIYRALNRTEGRGLFSYGLGEAPVTASSGHGNGPSRPINSRTFSTLWETVGFPRAITLHFFFIYGFFRPTVFVRSVCCRKWVQIQSLSKLCTIYKSQYILQIGLTTIFNRSPSFRSNWK